ncbi:hypothetical protein WICMUC_005372 [Wickerhamomyces mucosus]|uniref:Cysteine protease RIM13 n=1 Tax=Wickerhamomyces mucosus TaxID=1378264 RepID=A0A9P8T6E9_9ASCO|nr:hypothetical protein WICMUC_005372 [Wickerhamomyces mucosus]
MNSLYNVIKELEQAKLNWAIGNIVEAKKNAIKCVTLLNDLLKDKNAKINATSVKNVSQEIINTHSLIKSGGLPSIQTRIEWLGSALRGEIYPPVQLNPRLYYDVIHEQFPSDLVLSEKQTLLLEKWESISMKECCWTIEGLAHIYQDYLQDCSFVTALTSLSKNNSLLLLNMVSPLAHSTRYCIVLYFNGTQRLVEVNDKLPLLRNRSLFVKSRTNENLYWPALIEKAYLKVLGYGYNPKGSNASIDTFRVSGWIPQFIISSQRYNMDELWGLIYESYMKNRLVIALGTGDDTLEFYPNHDYSVVDIKEDTKTLVLKNPWKSDISFIDFNDIFDKFETLYLNWNPLGLIHKSLNFISNKKNELELFNKPQFKVQNNGNETQEIIILIEKHLGFNESSINVAVYSSSGETVFTKSQELNSEYIRLDNTGFHFSKFFLLENSSATIVVFNSSTQLQNFTIHSYSKSDISLGKCKLKYSNLDKIQGQWDIDTCGGNWSLQSYTKNPQYSIYVPSSDKESIMVTFALFSSNNLVNLQLFYKDSIPFSSNNPPLIHEKYQTDYLIKEIELRTNTHYKLVASLYEPNILGNFKIVVNSEVKLDISKIFNTLGLFITPFTFNWENKNRFKLRFQLVSRAQTRISIHMWSSSSISTYKPKIRASLFYQETEEAVQINSEFSDSIYGIWLQDIIIRPGYTVILLIERFEIGSDDITGEIGSDTKIKLIL